MGVLNIINWETGTDNLEATLSGTAAVSTAAAHFGSYGLRVNPTTTNTGYATLQTLSTTGVLENFNSTTTYIRFYFRYAAAIANPEPIFEAYDTTGTKKLEVRLQANQTLRILDSGGSPVGTSSALTANTWYRIEILIPNGTSTTITMRIDGTTAVSGTGNALATNSGSYRLGKATNVSGESVDFSYDDICIRDDDWPGDGVGVLLLPNANGTYTSWVDDTGNTGLFNYNRTDDWPSDSDTTYMKTSGNGNAVTFNVENCSVTGILGYIQCVKSIGYFRRTTSATNVNLRLRSGSTDDNTADFTTGASYSLIAKLYGLNPDGSGAWTTTALDSVQVGAVHRTAKVNELRCSSLGVMVDFRPVLAGQASLASVASVFGTGRLSLLSSTEVQCVGYTLSNPALTVRSDGTFQTVASVVGSPQVNLGGSTTIAGAANIDVTPRVNLAGFSTLAGIVQCDGSPGVNLAGTTQMLAAATIESTPSLTLLSSVNLSAVASLDSSPSVVLGQITAVLAGVCGLSPDAQVNYRASTDFAAVAALSNTPALSLSTTSNLQGISNIDGNAGILMQGNSTVQGVAATVLNAALTLQSSATISGAASLDSNPAVLLVGLVGVGGVASTEFVAVVIGTESLAFVGGVGQLLATGSITSVNTAVLGAASSMSGSGGLILTSNTVLGACTVLTSSPTLYVGATTNIAAVATLAADGSVVVPVVYESFMGGVGQLRANLEEVVGEIITLTLYVTPAYRD